MTDSDGYNGWTNHETWVVNLWLTTEESTYWPANRVCRIAPNAYEAGKALRELVEQDVLGETASATMATDLLTSALGAVNWGEIAAAFREES